MIISKRERKRALDQDLVFSGKTLFSVDPISEGG
jgi:hypothetical protein